MKKMTVMTELQRATTAQTFAGMRDEIANYSRGNSFGKSKKKLCSEFCACVEVLKTLSKRDLLMIWHLRNSFAGMSGNFARIALQQYEAKKAFDELNT